VVRSVVAFKCPGALADQCQAPQTRLLPFSPTCRNQEQSIRNNPGARLGPVQELAVILGAVLAEMLYRATLLVLLAHWLRDRAFEAGLEEEVFLPLLGQQDTGTAAAWAALGLGVSLGAAAFAVRAYQVHLVAGREAPPSDLGGLLQGFWLLRHLNSWCGLRP
jgi:hypothetical protein